MNTTVTPTAAKPRKLAGATVGIPPRQMEFRRLEEGSRYFYDNNPTATLFFAMLSAIFPPGELFFMDTVRHYRDRVTDPVLKAKISGFIGQEAIHTREHERLNELLKARGFDVMVAQKGVAAGLKLLEKLPPSQQLACTTFMEHFTALLGEQLLNDENFRSKADPEMIGLWQWHALEELEHKAVAYEVYELIGNSRTERLLSYPLVVAALLPPILGSWLWMVAKDGQLLNWKENRRGLQLLLGRNGFVTRILPRMGLFARKDFHPNRHHTAELEKAWRERLFGAQGILNAELRNREALAA
jgi:predicted metal-dependent hydrolase